MYHCSHRNENHQKCFPGFDAWLCVLSPSEWDDVVVVRKGEPATLTCTDPTVRDPVAINWKVKSQSNWELVLSANDHREFSGRASKHSMRLADPHFKDTGNFSLFLNPTVDDRGLYLCLIQPRGRGRVVKERTVLLAILTGKDMM